MESIDLIRDNLCLQYAADHSYMHRGRLADARRAAGPDRMRA